MFHRKIDVQESRESFPNRIFWLKELESLPPKPDALAVYTATEVTKNVPSY
jgi:hypothetical protein